MIVDFQEGEVKGIMVGLQLAALLIFCEMHSRLLNKKLIADELLNHPVVEQLRAAGLINETKLRNYNLISDYVSLKESHGHPEACEILAERYFLSFERVCDILFK